MGKPLVIIGALAVLMFNATFQAATTTHRLIAMGIVVAAVLLPSALLLLSRIGSRRKPAPRTPASTYYPPSAPRQRSRSGRR